MELLSKYYYIHLLVGSTALFLHSDCVISLTPTARARCLAQLCECLLQPALPGRSLAASLRDRREGNAAVGPLVSEKATSRSGFCLYLSMRKEGIRYSLAAGRKKVWRGRILPGNSSAFPLEGMEMKSRHRRRQRQAPCCSRRLGQDLDLSSLHLLRSSPPACSSRSSSKEVTRAPSAHL